MHNREAIEHAYNTQDLRKGAVSLSDTAEDLLAHHRGSALDLNSTQLAARWLYINARLKHWTDNTCLSEYHFQQYLKAVLQETRESCFTPGFSNGTL
jgi:hypothetical protein